MRSWLMVVPAVLVGTATHVLWDEFTHAGRFGATQISAIGASYPTPVGTIPGLPASAVASGAIGLALVIWVGLRQPSRDPEPCPRPGLARAAAWLVPVSALSAAAIRISALQDRTDLRALAFAAITAAIATATSVAVLLTAGQALTGNGRRTLRPTP